MEAGLPFICTDYTLWKEIIDEYKCGLYVEPGNVEQIKNAIQYLLDHPKTAFEMGQNGRRAVIERFNWRSQEISYVAMFNKMNH